MFIYSFKDTTCLLRHLVISGQSIALYFSRAQTMELDSLVSAGLLENTTYFDNDGEHYFLHHPFVSFSSSGDTTPHKHYEFTSKHRFNNLRDICQHLISEQDRTEKRLQEYQQLLKYTKEEKIYKHNRPNILLEIGLNQYDIHTPFIPTQEVPDLLNKFHTHTNTINPNSLAEHAKNYALELLELNGDILYQSFPHRNELTSNQANLIHLYKSLRYLYRSLLGLNNHRSKYAANIQRLIFNIEKNPYFACTTNSSFAENCFKNNLQHTHNIPQPKTNINISKQRSTPFSRKISTNNTKQALPINNAKQNSIVGIKKAYIFLFLNLAFLYLKPSCIKSNSDTYTFLKIMTLLCSLYIAKQHVRKLKQSKNCFFKRTTAKSRDVNVTGLISRRATRSHG